ncbi:MAG TPA: hypothetical protein VG821_01835 [Rhizomicrobium sp.]|nr:hypothetical protein [Rhizomicrobium sp.]
MKLTLMAATSGLALCAFLIAVPAYAQDHVDANGMPTDHSTPAERAETAQINNQVQSANAAADATAAANDAKYQAQQQQYQSKLQQNQAAQEQYQDQTARYNALRSRYAAERAAYHRGIWPDRYVHWTLENPARSLVGQRVEILNGDHVGTVKQVAHGTNRNVDGVLVELDGGKLVWIDASDIRYDSAGGVLMTNLERADLRAMSDERM